MTNPIATYHKLKANHPDTLLLFRIGDFYELFYDDAKQAAKHAFLSLTTRKQKDASSVPMAGFPCHCSNQYISRLVRAGLRIAVINTT